MRAHRRDWRRRTRHQRALDTGRLASFEKLLKELRDAESRDDPSAARAQKRLGRIGSKALTKMYR